MDLIPDEVDGTSDCRSVLKSGKIPGIFRGGVAFFVLDNNALLNFLGVSSFSVRQISERVNFFHRQYLSQYFRFLVFFFFFVLPDQSRLT